MNEVGIGQSVHVKAGAEVAVQEGSTSQGETCRWVSVRSQYNAVSLGVFAADADTAERLADAFGVLAYRMRKDAERVTEPAVVVPGEAA